MKVIGKNQNVEKIEIVNQNTIIKNKKEENVKAYGINSF